MKKRVAVLSVSFTILVYMVITVAVAGLTAAFPDVPEDTLLLAVTLPNLTCVPAILSMPLLLRWFSQKAVTVGGLALTLLGGGLYPGGAGGLSAHHYHRPGGSRGGHLPL